MKLTPLISKIHIERISDLGACAILLVATDPDDPHGAYHLPGIPLSYRAVTACLTIYPDREKLELIVADATPHLCQAIYREIHAIACILSRACQRARKQATR